LITKPWTFRHRLNELRRYIIEKYINDYLRPVKKQNKEKFSYRKYKNYKDYLNHQSKKFKIVESNLKNAYTRRLKEFEKEFEKDLPKNNAQVFTILCLGARDGVEVNALRNLGFLAIGIDIEFSRNNKYVHYGDFHEIPFPNSVFDMVYTNCLDHSFNINDLFAEIKRVLKKNGKFLTDVSKESPIGSFESFGWEDINDVINILEINNFKLQNKNDILGTNGRKRFLFQLK